MSLLNFPAVKAAPAASGKGLDAGEQASAPTPPSCELVYESPCDLVAMVGDCLVVVMVKELTPLCVNAVGRGFASLTRRYAKVNYFSVIEQGTLVMHPEARREMAKVVSKHTQNIKGAAFVCHGTGFRATAVRSVITAIHMASFASHPLRVFSALDPALAWLGSKQAVGELDLAALSAELGRLRARFV